MALNPQAVNTEGRVAVPVTIANAGLLDGRFDVAYQLLQGATVVTLPAKSYYLPKGGSTTDIIYLDLMEGSYQLTATGQLPPLSASAGFSVRKENKVEMSLTAGAQTGELLPVTVTLTNKGGNSIDGTTRLTVIDGQGSVVWSASQAVNLPQSPVPASQPLPFTINLAAMKPGSHTIRADLLDNGNQTLATQSIPLAVQGPLLTVTQIPPYRAIPAGGDATMTFRVKNSGNKEGTFAFAFKADDLIDSTRTDWLKPGEEKEVTFRFMAPSDLEDKDYVSHYRLKTDGTTLAEGVVTYRVEGIRLAVTASLDRQNYSVGDTANLTLTITRQDAGVAPNLFVRVNYNGFEEKRDFQLSGSQTLSFAVPLPQITGEKLFYGIYADTGRSIHLNALYIHKADELLSITTNRQVYNPGETVSVNINGNSTGNLTLSGPGDFSDTFVFAGSAVRSFTLPSTMIAGTYKVNSRLVAADGSAIAAVHPFDVAGIQVKVKEALLDKPKYAATDVIKFVLTVESNQDTPATVRTWVVDPAGNYAEAGSIDANLDAVRPVLLNLNSSLLTGSLGIHKLVYGIYQGNLLLASGAKAFDIGEAVLLGIATDRTDYPEITLPVTVKADLYGQADVGLEFFLDGAGIRANTLALAGFASHTFVIPPAALMPGLHTLKVVLTTGGLTSTKELSFTYGSGLPELTARIIAAALNGAVLPLTVTVTNQGTTAAAQNTLALYDGDPAKGGKFIASLGVPALQPGTSASLPYNWSVLGKSGDQTVHVLVDAENVVTEFNEGNNGAWYTVSLPNLAFAVTTGKPAYGANEEVGVSVSLANLTAGTTFNNVNLKTELADSKGATTILVDKAIAALLPALETSAITGWNTASNPPGNYAVNARLSSGATELAKGAASFIIKPTFSFTGKLTLVKPEVIQGFPLTVDFTVLNNGNIDITDGLAMVEFIEKSSGMAAKTVSQHFAHLPLLQSLSRIVDIGKIDLPPGDYSIRLNAVASGVSFPIDEKVLKILPPLEVAKGLSASSRVLVFLEKKDKEDGEYGNSDDGHERGERISRTAAVIRQALDGMEIYYTIAHDAKQFKAAVRSGFYNSYILAGEKPLPDHLAAELAERINSGEGLVLFNYEKVENAKFRELSRVKQEGHLNDRPRELAFFDSPIAQAGTGRIIGEMQKLRVTSANVQVVAVIEEKGEVYPAVLLNTYGMGKLAVFAFDSDVSLLQRAITYIAPDRTDTLAGVPLPVEIRLNSLGAPFELRVTETVDSMVPVLFTYPHGTTEQGTISWQLGLMGDETRKLLYLCNLPADGGSFDLSTTVDYLKNGSYETYGSYHLPLTVARGVVALKSDILNGLTSLHVSEKGAGKLRRIIHEYEAILGRVPSGRDDTDKIIKELVGLIGEVRELPMDTSIIRLDLDRLLMVYERVWAEKPWR
jgi:hypothetical protein